MSSEHHHQHHAGHHVHDHAKANEDHFDKHGLELFEHEDAKDSARKTVKALTEIYPFDKEKTTVLDFACGAGNVSVLLADHAKSITGIDISGKMIDYYNEVAAKNNLKGKMAGARADILTDASALDGKTFDVAICSLSYHHFTSPEKITSVLASHLVPGGELIIIDLLPAKDGSDAHKQFSQKAGMSEEEFKHFVAHKHFDENDVKRIFSAGGISFQEYKQTFTMTWKGVDKECFIAKGTKA